MELDKKIKSNYKIFICFDTEKAKKYIGTQGYFTNDMSYFHNLDDCYKGTLSVVDNNSSRPYLNADVSRYFESFLPEEFVKQKEVEKKYRPYTFQEFCDKFTVGLPIKFRPKGKVGYERYLILNGYEHEQREGQTFTYIYIGPIPYTFDELFRAYEWQEHYTKDFEPFGVEE